MFLTFFERNKIPYKDIDIPMVEACIGTKSIEGKIPGAKLTFSSYFSELSNRNFLLLLLIIYQENRNCMEISSKLSRMPKILKTTT
ncbi:hypothetical protein HZS_6638 [Henneguya salminicola]|nr:hypothetical protein HZS_6638 [Henneguya salminicola]